MKNIFILSIVCLTFLQPMAEAIFHVPIALGLTLGAIAVGKGLILGSILSKHKTSHYHYHYPPQHHSYHRGKRSSEPISMEELMRLKKEVRDNIMTDDWYMEVVEKDQDDCTKRLICEISSKKESGEVLTVVEEEIIGIFGKGRAVDTSKSTAIFDFAAQAGKYWKKGGYGCEFFARCDTPTSDIVAMIENELEDFRQLEESFLNDASRAESAMERESNEVEEMVNEIEL